MFEKLVLVINKNKDINFIERPCESCDLNNFDSLTKPFHQILNNTAVADLTKTIRRLIKDGERRPFLSLNQNHFRANKTRPLVEHIRQV